MTPEQSNADPHPTATDDARTLRLWLKGYLRGALSRPDPILRGRIEELLEQVEAKLESAPMNADPHPNFEECPACRAKPGSPLLCAQCLERRDLYEERDKLRARIATSRRRGEKLCKFCGQVPPIKGTVVSGVTR